MKKILAMLLALACVLSFAACASKKTDDTIGEEKPSTSEQTPTEPEAPTEEPDAPAEKPADDENAAKPDDGMLDDEFGVGEPSEENAPAAEGGTENAESTQEALDLLNKIWASYKDEEKFPAAGPANDAVKLDGAASIMHMMNGNTFTCGAFHVANADDVSSIAEDIHSEISGKHWMCGFPDKMFLATNGNLIVSVYGNEDLVNTFRDKLFAADAGFTSVYDEAISA